MTTDSLVDELCSFRVLNLGAYQPQCAYAREGV